MAFDPSQYEEYLKQLQSNPAPDPTISSIDPSKYPEYLNMLKGTPAPQPAAQIALPASIPPTVDAPPSATAAAQDDSAWHAPMVLPKEATMEVAPATSAPKEPTGLDFGQAEDNVPKMTDVLATQNNMNLIAGLGKSADQVGQAIAGTKREENPVYNDIQKQAAAIPGEYKAAKEDDKHDPNSQISKGFRDYVVNQLGVPIKGNPSADDLSTVAPYLFKNYEARLAEQGKLEAKKLDVESKKEIASGRLDENARWHDLVASMKHDNADAASEKDQTKRQAATLKSTQTFLESSRNLPDVRQALLDKYNIGKAEAILKGRDLNDLSSNEVGIFVNELGKIARGGVPTHEELKAISPSSLSGSLRKQYSQLINAPTPANAGAFLKQYQKYLGELKSNAEDTISKKVRRVIDTNKKDLGDENYSTLQTQYSDMLNPESANAAQQLNISPEVQSGAAAELARRRQSQGQ